MAFGDLDNDGDQDIFEQLGGFYPGDEFANVLFENPRPAGGQGPGAVDHAPPRRAGAPTDSASARRIEAQVSEGGERRSIHVVVGSGGSFGASSLQQEIGLGRAEAIEEIIVRWPGGTVDRIAAPALDRFYKLVEGSGTLVPVEVPRLVLGGGGR